VERLATQLELSAGVEALVVPGNPLIVSVESAKDRINVFLLAIDAGFLALLNDDELEAAVAHELGHVWLATHHPYLQTEQLANRIALRLVERKTLRRIYERMAEYGGPAIDLAHVLDE
jgi:hypothetical protein